MSIDSLCQLFIFLFPLLSSYLFASFLSEKEDIINKINMSFLILCCQIILICCALSLFNGLTGGNFLLATAALFLISYAICKNKTEAIQFDIGQIKACACRLSYHIKKNRLLALFLFATVISVLWRIFLIIYVPPNNYDSMTYHLTKVAYWLQHRSLSPFPTFDYRLTSFPFNAELLLLWTMVAAKADCYCGFIQFFCYLLSGTLVYKCSRHYLKAGAVSSLTTMLIWYSLPEVVLQSTSTQNDLVVAYFLMFSLVYLLCSTTNPEKYLPVSAVALAVAIGTKLTALFFLIPFIIIIVYLSIAGAWLRKRIFLWGAVFIVAFLIFGAYTFIQNYTDYRDPIVYVREKRAKVFSQSPQSFVTKSSRHLHNMMTNQSGMDVYAPAYAHYYNALINKISARVFRAIERVFPYDPGPRYPGYPLYKFKSGVQTFALDEDNAFFGSVGMVMVLVVLYVLFTAPIRLFIKRINTDSRYFIFAFLFAGYLIPMSHIMRWDPWISRYMITGVLAGMPVLALLFESRISFLKKAGSIVVIYSIMALLPATFLNVKKPLYELHNDKLTLRCIFFRDREIIIRQFNRLVPPHAKIGLALWGDSWTYPLFGERLQRQLTPLNGKILESQRFDFIAVVANLLEKAPWAKQALEADYKSIAALGNRSAEHNEWILYAHK